ncbi:unnamed protein product [Rotaria magnacalcarata]
MPNSSSSNIIAAKRTRRSNKQHRHRHELLHVIRYPSLNNIAYYTKHFFFKTAFGRLILFHGYKVQYRSMHH